MAGTAGGSEQPVPGKPGRRPIGESDEQQAYHRLEYTDGRRHAVLHLQQPLPVHEGVDNIARMVNGRIVQHQNLVEAGIENAAQA
ncbi:hypothetical protein D3C86_1978360 [compost metagenome]